MITDIVLDMAFPTPEQLTRTLDTLVSQFGVLIEDIKVTQAGAKSAVKIAVDSADPLAARPDLDALGEISNEVSRLLDEAEEAGELNFGPGYTLELSTPGLDFPLTLPRHWQRNIGRLAKIPQTGTQRILQADEEGVVLLKKNKKKITVSAHGFGDVAGAVVEVEFNNVPADEAGLVGLERHEYEPLIEQADKENK